MTLLIDLEEFLMVNRRLFWLRELKKNPTEVHSAAKTLSVYATLHLFSRVSNYM